MNLVPLRPSGLDNVYTMPQVDIDSDTDGAGITRIFVTERDTAGVASNVHYTDTSIAPNLDKWQAVLPAGAAQMRGLKIVRPELVNGQLRLVVLAFFNNGTKETSQYFWLDDGKAYVPPTSGGTGSGGSGGGTGGGNVADEAKAALKAWLAS